MFLNRKDAGSQLARKIQKFAGPQALILAVPRGGVPLGYEIALQTGIPLELLLTKKIGHPQNREFAIGSVSLTDTYLIPYNGIPEQYIKNETRKIRERLHEMWHSYTGNGNPSSLKDKTLIIVDDGAATGNTVLGAINVLRKAGPAKIIVAIPVASRQAAESLKEAADELICLLIPDHFFGVSGFYKDFHQVSDQEVIQCLTPLKLKTTNHA